MAFRGNLLALVLLASAAVAGPPPGSWFNAVYDYRRLVTIRAQSAGSPAGYSHRVTVDHQTLVALGKSQADGSDLRVVRWNGSAWIELDRVLDTGSGYGLPNTTLWFRSTVALPPGISDDEVYLYYGCAACTGPLKDGDNVFLAQDDFENPGLMKWAKVNGVGLWSRVTGTAHRGSGSLYYPPEPPTGVSLVASPPINEADVAVDAWIRMQGLITTDISLDARSSNPPAKAVGANYEGFEGINLYEFSDPNYFEHAPNGGAFSEGVWTRITVALYGGQGRVWQNGVQVAPVTGVYDAGFGVSTGNVGIGKYVVAPDGGFWADDFNARKYVDPEPTVTLGPEELYPPLIPDSGVPDAGTLPDGGSPPPTDGGGTVPVAGVRFTSTPSTDLLCTQEWNYTPSVAGASSPSFRLVGDGRTTLPSGLTVEASSGALRWTPAQRQAGVHHLNLVVEAAEGTATQPVDLTVVCDPSKTNVGCGCGAGSAIGPLLAGALLLVARRRKRVSAGR